MPFWAWLHISFLHFISLSKTNSIQISTREEKMKNNKAHSLVVCHWFVGNLLGVGADATCRMNCSVCQMKLFIAGKHPKQTQQLGADISICTGKENEEETVWLLVDVRHLTGRLKAARACVCACLSACVSVGGGCCHFLLRSLLLYVCPLAWTPVRSFLMISFTSSR